MGRSRRTAAELPRAPLELLHPLAVQPAAPAAVDVLREVPAPMGMTVYRVARAVLAWSRDPAAAAGAANAELARIERELLECGTGPLTSPLGLLAGYMAAPSPELARDVAWACVCVTDWAAVNDAPATAVLFAQAAALAAPRNARYAWMAGRMLRAHGRNDESELWLRRAYRVAVWTDDHEAQGLALNSVGNLHLARGRFGVAKRLLCRALRVAERHGHVTLQGEISHDLFITFAQTGAVDAAEQFAARAFRTYGATHHRMPALVHDVAQFWVDQGYYGRALPVFMALLPLFKEAAGRVRVLAGAMHAAGARADRAQFEKLWAEFDSIAGNVADPLVVASAFVEAGLGAAALGHWARATATLETACKRGREIGAADLVLRAEHLLSQAQAERIAVTAPDTGRIVGKIPVPAGDLLAREFIRSLQEVSPREPRLTVVA